MANLGNFKPNTAHISIQTAKGIYRNLARDLITETNGLIAKSYQADSLENEVNHSGYNLVRQIQSFIKDVGILSRVSKKDNLQEVPGSDGYKLIVNKDPQSIINLPVVSYINVADLEEKIESEKLFKGTKIPKLFHDISELAFNNKEEVKLSPNEQNFAEVCQDLWKNALSNDMSKFMTSVVNNVNAHKDVNSNMVFALRLITQTGANMDNEITPYVEPIGNAEKVIISAVKIESKELEALQVGREYYNSETVSAYIGKFYETHKLRMPETVKKGFDDLLENFEGIGLDDELEMLRQNVLSKTNDISVVAKAGKIELTFKKTDGGEASLNRLKDLVEGNFPDVRAPRHQGNRLTFYKGVPPKLADALGVDDKRLILPEGRAK